jgi:type III secretion YscU/HrpY family protein
MSAEKTEKPTKHKLKESAEKGESYSSKDIIAAAIVIAGVVSLSAMSLGDVANLFKDFLSHGDDINIRYVAERSFKMFLKLVLPVIGICILATAIPSLIQSKFVLAFDALEIKFDALNPVNGFKNIFSIKTVKELAKALVYLILFSFVVISFFNFYKHMLLGLIYIQPAAIGPIWLKAGSSVVLLCMLVFAVVIVFDGIADYMIYIKDQKMDKHEVKQEHREMEGDPEIKARRKELHQELLSAQDRLDIEQSNFILANPTHIAIGIFVNQEVAVLPMVSVAAKGERALAIIKYAEKQGVPVVRDILVARRMIKEVRRYAFIPLEMIEPVYRILIWLKEVELAHLRDTHPELAAEIDAVLANSAPIVDAGPDAAKR